MPDQSVLQCRIIGKFRLNGLPITNPVAVGDKVMVDVETALIKKILPRVNYVARQSPRKKHDLHLMASNVDQAVLIITIIEPNLKQGFIDRFLLMTEPYNIPTCIVFNKADIYGEQEVDIFLYMKDLYESLDYKVLLTSATTGYGVEALQQILHGKVSLVSGQSGVGKSSLVNAVAPALHLRTQELSDYSGKGQHTTTFAEMFRLEGGGAIIDTPGIKTLSFNHFEPKDVAHNFREFFALSEQCRFRGDCLHRNEPGCAVKKALEAEEVSPLRYENYLAILGEIEEQNYWERRKEL